MHRIASWLRQRVVPWLRTAGAWLKGVFWRRRAASLALVVLASFLLFAASFAIYVRQVALDTPTWVTASSKMLTNDTIRPILADYLVDQLFTSTDVPARLESALPSPLDRLAGPVAGLLREQAVRAANRMLESPRVQELWEQANRVAHDQFVAAVEGGNRNENGDVVLDLGPLVQQLGQRIGLPQTVTTALSRRVGQIVVLKADRLENAEKAANALRIASIWLAIAAFVAAVGAVALARGRRRETVRAQAVGLLVVAFALLVVRRFIGTAVIDAIVDAQSVRPAGVAAWFIATEALSQTGWVIFSLGVIGVVWSWLSGPMRWAAAARRWLGPKIAGSVAAFYAVAALIALILLAWGPFNNLHTLVGEAIFFVVLVAGVEGFRRQVVREYRAGMSGEPA